MNTLAKYWKVILALVLVLVAVFFYTNKYMPEKAIYESEARQLETMILTMENSIRENEQYADVQDQLDDAKAELDASRQELYEAFPVEMKEEDQIMYVLYLETLFKEEIFFSFNQAVIKTPLRDGAALEVLELDVNYATTYQGFQDMVTYLSTDSRVVSLQEASIQYDVASDYATGELRLWLYLMDSDKLEYMRPDVAVPETGKENIFEDRTVWIAKNDSKYHSDSSCGSMKDPDEVNLEEAKERGLTACSKCYITVWVEEYGPKYHKDSKCSNVKDPIQITLDEAFIVGRTACTECCDEAFLYEYVIPLEAKQIASSGSGSGTVWIPNSGDKYHSNSSCSGMENPTQVSLDEAVNRGFTACSKCY